MHVQQAAGGGGKVPAATQAALRALETVAHGLWAPADPAFSRSVWAPHARTAWDTSGDVKVVERCVPKQHPPATSWTQRDFAVTSGFAVPCDQLVLPECMLNVLWTSPAAGECLLQHIALALAPHGRAIVWHLDDNAVQLAALKARKASSEESFPVRLLDPSCAWLMWASDRDANTPLLWRWRKGGGAWWLHRVSDNALRTASSGAGLVVQTSWNAWHLWQGVVDGCVPLAGAKVPSDVVDDDVRACLQMLRITVLTRHREPQKT